MDDVYATGRSHVLRHILEHRKHPAALKVEHHGTSEDYEYLKRLRSPREDALESQPNPRYLQKVVSTTASRVTILVWSERRIRRTRSACRPRENRIQLNCRIFELHCHGDKQCEINLLAVYMVSPTKKWQYDGSSAWSDTQLQGEIMKFEWREESSFISQVFKLDAYTDCDWVEKWIDTANEARALNAHMNPSSVLHVNIESKLQASLRPSFTAWHQKSLNVQCSKK